MRAVVKRASVGIWEKSAEKTQPWKGKGREICVNRKSLEWQNYISQLYSNYFSSFLAIFFCPEKYAKNSPPVLFFTLSSRIFSIFVFFFIFLVFFFFYELFQRKIRQRTWTNGKVFKSFRGNEGGVELLTKMAECLSHLFFTIDSPRSKRMNEK